MRGRGRPGSLESFGFFPEFLGAAFAEVMAAGGDEPRCGCRVDVLGDADERNFVGTPADRLGSAGDAFLNAVEVIGDRHGKSRVSRV